MRLLRGRELAPLVIELAARGQFIALAYIGVAVRRDRGLGGGPATGFDVEFRYPVGGQQICDAVRMMGKNAGMVFTLCVMGRCFNAQTEFGVASLPTSKDKKVDRRDTVASGCPFPKSYPDVLVSQPKSAVSPSIAR